MRILLVEDDQHLGTTLNRALNFEGYVSDWVKTVNQAQDNLAHGDYDMMVLDWMLPDQPGIALLKDLRQKGRRSANSHAYSQSGYSGKNRRA